MTVAGVVALSGTGITHAQSSFHEPFSAGSVLSAPPEDPAPHSGTVTRLETAFVALHEHTGVPVREEFQRNAQEYADLGAAGELEYVPVSDGSAEGIFSVFSAPGEDEFFAFVWRLTPEQAGVWAENLEAELSGEPGEEVREIFRTGNYAAASDGEHIYIAFSGAALPQ